MTVATSGTLNYEDVANIIEALVHTEGRRTPIPGMDFEDTAQEIRTECIRVLYFYDPERIGPSPFKFLQTCVKNFLFNQRRGIWVPNNPPCVRCPLWDRQNKLCLVNEVDCDKIVQYRRNMSTKAALREPNSLEFDVLDDHYEQNMDADALDQSIRKALPDHLITPYEKMLLGEKVSGHIKKQVRDIAMSVINDG